jgi:hypothetical protein
VSEAASKTCLIYDHAGLYCHVALALAHGFDRVLYFSEWRDAFSTSKGRLIGDGFEEIERIRDFEDGLADADMVMFPDMGRYGLQAYLRSLGMPVWGMGQAEMLEDDKMFFHHWLLTRELPTPDMWQIEGIDALREFLEKHEEVYVKSNDRGDFECVDDQTEIFTKDGWRFFKDINEQAEVLTMDVETRKACFKKIDRYYASYYEGEMYEVDAPRVNLLVTPRHKFFMKPSTNPYGSWCYRAIEEIYADLEDEDARFYVPLKCIWSGREKAAVAIPAVPQGNSHRSEDRLVQMDLWLSFLGWFLSEGCLNLSGANKNTYRITISQSKTANREYWDEIHELLDRLGYHYVYEGEIGFSIYNKALWMFLSDCYGESCSCGKNKCCHNKKIPGYVKQLSSRQIQIFLESYRKGDGHITQGEVRYDTSSAQLASDVQELIFKCGKVGTIRLFDSQRQGISREYGGKVFFNRFDCFTICEANTDCRIRKRQIQKVQYKGWIYDVEVNPHHSIFLRRNGKCVWTGNSYHHRTWQLSEPWFHDLMAKIGPYKDIVEIIAQSPVEGVEVGYDGYLIDGRYPPTAQLGFECKNKGYIGRLLPYDDLPKPMIQVCQAVADWARKEEFIARGMFCSEVRLETATRGYFIDPTMRCGIPPSSCQSIAWSNFPEIIWHGAQGKLVDLRCPTKYLAELELTSEWAATHFMPVYWPDEYNGFVTLTRWHRYKDVNYVVPTGSLDGSANVGAAVGMGDTAEAAMAMALEVAQAIDAYDINFDTAAFEKLDGELEAYSKLGCEF